MRNEPLMQIRHEPCERLAGVWEQRVEATPGKLAEAIAEALRRLGPHMRQLAVGVFERAYQLAQTEDARRDERAIQRRASQQRGIAL